MENSGMAEQIQQSLKEAMNELLPKLLDEVLPPLINRAIEPLALKLQQIDKDNAELRKRVDDLENQLIADQLEFVGVPQTVGENTNEIAKKILSKLQLDDQNIAHAVISSYRLPKPKDSNLPAKIIVQLSNSHIKRLAYSKRVKSPVTSDDLGLGGSSRIYINERLRSNLRPTFYKLVQLKKQKQISTVWTHNQAILVKVKQTDSAQMVADIDQFMRSLKPQRIGESK